MVENTLSQQSHDYRRVEQVIRYLEANFQEQPSLDEIAASIHLSKFHFQRLFRRWVGISPTQFLRFLTIEYAKERLREANSVLEAAFDAGLSSPSRLHDLFVTYEAITPGEYKRLGAGLQITYGFHDTPFGICLLATTRRGICSLYFVKQDGLEPVLEELGIQWPEAVLVEDGGATRPLVERIFALALVDQRRPFHLLLKGTNFQINVWRALLAIPPGAMVSYGDVATFIGKRTAARAVGHAVGRNPISFLIPCHRVINKSGKAHRYRWGTARKKAMLGWEASRQVG